MMKFMKTCCNKTNANVVDGNLILTLPSAVVPSVWKMDLTETQSAALEVHTQENGQSSLELKAAKGKNTVIALFEKREAAIAALMAASKAMESAPTQIYSGTTASGDAPAHLVHAPKAKKNFVQKAFTFLGVLAILFLLYSIIMVFSGGGSRVTQVSGSSQQSSAPQNGVPVSADDFLSGR